MPLAPDFVLQQITAEVQYDRGALYFDRCGSLLLELQDALGGSFQSIVAPTMSHGELQSPTERIVVQYGPEKLVGTQAWVSSPARLELVLPEAWDIVEKTLNVATRVKRCGVRYQALWKTDSLAEAREYVARVGPPQVEPWRTIAGDSAARAVVVYTEDRRGMLRAGLDTMEATIAGELPPDLQALVPKAAVLFDVDHTYPGTAPLTIRRAALKDFIRLSWERTRGAAAVVQRHLS